MRVEVYFPCFLSIWLFGLLIIVFIVVVIISHFVEFFGRPVNATLVVLASTFVHLVLVEIEAVWIVKPALVKSVKAISVIFSVLNFYFFSSEPGLSVSIWSF